ncbi:MAG: hypothetical protein NTY53_26100 [Kiritimatiellaeota bacterium]|nr:hypothetical protein [Kiritimatiellota bacterium]
MNTLLNNGYNRLSDAFSVRLLATATPEEKQKAYEDATEYWTNVFLLRQLEARNAAANEQRKADEQEAKRAKAAAERIAYATTRKINAPVGRMELFVNYMGGAVTPLCGFNHVGNPIFGTDIGRDVKNAGAKYDTSKAKGLSAFFGYQSTTLYGGQSHLVIKFGKPEVMQKLVNKYNLPESALTVNFADGATAKFYRSEQHESLIQDYLLSDVVISRTLFIMADDKLTFDASKLDENGYIKQGVNQLLTDLHSVRTSPTTVKEQIIGLR